MGVILGESTTTVQWDLQKFHDFIGVRHLLRLGAECGFSMRVAVVDLQVHLGWRPCVGLALLPSHRLCSKFSHASARNMLC